MSFKYKLIKFFGLMLYSIISLVLIGLIYVNPLSHGSNNVIVIVLEAILVIVTLFAMKLWLRPPLSNYTGLWRMLLFFTMTVFMTGALLTLKHKQSPGGWMFYGSMCVLFLLYLIRIDLLVKEIAIESMLDRHKKMLYGSVGFVIPFIYLLIQNGAFNIGTWIGPFTVMCLIVGVSTIRSRMRILRTHLPELMTEEERKSLARHLEIHGEYSYKDMVDQQYETDAAQASATKTNKFMLFTLLYCISYPFLAVAAGCLVIIYYLYQGLGSRYNVQHSG